MGSLTPSQIVRVLILIIAAALIIIGMTVGLTTRPSVPVKGRLRYAPVWKQRSLFDSSEKYHRYLFGVWCVSIGSLLVGIVSFWGLFEE